MISNKLLNVLFCFVLQSHIPKRLDDVKNAEEDAFRITSGQDTEDINYKTITGLKAVLKAQPSPAEQEANPIEDSSVNTTGQINALVITESQTVEDEENSSDSEGSFSSETDSETPADKKAARKENKKKVKEEKREARKTKVPKAVKKRKKKLAKSHKTR